MPSLIAIKNVIKEKQIINLQSLAAHFQVQADSLRPMVNMLVMKGYVCERKSPQCGTSCNRCDIKAMSIYYWQGTRSTVDI